MLNEAKLNCQAIDPHYEAELCRLIRAAEIILKTRGITFAGTFQYQLTAEEGTGLPMVHEWSCTITDDWVKTAMLAYVKAKFPGTKDPESYMEAFVTSVNAMMNTTGYGIDQPVQEG